MRAWDEINESERQMYLSQAQYLIQQGFITASDPVTLAESIFRSVEKSKTEEAV